MNKHKFMNHTLVGLDILVKMVKNFELISQLNTHGCSDKVKYNKENITGIVKESECKVNGIVKENNGIVKESNSYSGFKSFINYYNGSIFTIVGSSIKILFNTLVERLYIGKTNKDGLIKATIENVITSPISFLVCCISPSYKVGVLNIINFIYIKRPFKLILYYSSINTIRRLLYQLSSNIIFKLQKQPHQNYGSINKYSITSLVSLSPIYNYCCIGINLITQSLLDAIIQCPLNYLSNQYIKQFMGIYDYGYSSDTVNPISLFFQIKKEDSLIKLYTGFKNTFILCLINNLIIIIIIKSTSSSRSS